jgi:adenosylcobinamide kinase/adenosylcobinamide-phosphate guanylyltransferase
MRELTFVIGGCRSGKSRHALQLAEQIPAQKRIFVATCVPLDEEMEQRVLRHKKERGQNWITIEAPIRLPEIISENNQKGNVVLADCLTLWISNIILENNNIKKTDLYIEKLKLSLDDIQCPILLVSNEVGSGIVPENRLARQFRDVAGFVNQKIAARADQVIWMVAGIPVLVKQGK